MHTKRQTAIKISKYHRDRNINQFKIELTGDCTYISYDCDLKN